MELEKIVIKTKLILDSDKTGFDYFHNHYTCRFYYDESYFTDEPDEYIEKWDEIGHIRFDVFLYEYGNLEGDYPYTQFADYRFEDSGFLDFLDDKNQNKTLRPDILEFYDHNVKNMNVCYFEHLSFTDGPILSIFVEYVFEELIRTLTGSCGLFFFHEKIFNSMGDEAQDFPEYLGLQRIGSYNGWFYNPLSSENKNMGRSSPIGHILYQLSMRNWN